MRNLIAGLSLFMRQIKNVSRGVGKSLESGARAGSVIVAVSSGNGVKIPLADDASFSCRSWPLCLNPRRHPCCAPCSGRGERPCAEPGWLSAYMAGLLTCRHGFHSRLPGPVAQWFCACRHAEAAGNGNVGLQQRVCPGFSPGSLLSPLGRRMPWFRFAPLSYDKTS